jgi:hypothetical protein
LGRKISFTLSATRLTFSNRSGGAFSMPVRTEQRTSRRTQGTTSSGNECRSLNGVTLLRTGRRNARRHKESRDGNVARDLRRTLSYAEWCAALERWQREDPSARNLINCCGCGVPIPVPPCPDSRPGTFCLFDTCDACVEESNRENDGRSEG